MADIRKLTKRKSVLKAQLTRFNTFLNNFVSEPDNIIQLRTRLETIQGIYTEFDTIQTEIEFDNDDEEVAKTLTNERVDVETRYIEAVSRSKKILNPNLGQIEQSVTNQPSFNSQPPTPVETSVKLPPLKLPEFHGDYDKWIQFSDTFKSAIHNNASLSRVQKHQYLVSCLKGPAERVISGLSIAENNYDSAWALLNERYEDTKAIINAHVKAIFLLPSTNRDTHISLRLLLDEFLVHYHALENLGEEVSHWDTMLIFLLTGKMDSKSNEEFEHYTKTITKPKVSDLIDFLKERCKLLENIKNRNSYTGCANNSNIKRNVDIKPIAKSFAHVTTNQITCPVCQQNHYIYSCKKLRDMPINTRYDELKRLRLCTNCLRPGHNYSDCNSSGCKTCQRKHNTLLHRTPFVKNENIQKTSTSAQSNVETSVESQAETAKNSETQTSHCSILTNCSQSHADSYVLLSTALIYLYDKNEHPIVCRALLDSASQSSYIRTDIVKRLGLQTNDININISGISQATTIINKQVGVKLKSMHTSHTTNLSCLVIDKITGNIPQHQIDVSMINIPPTINLADPNFGTPSQIDILIGASAFYELLCIGQHKMGKDQPILCKTKLGWVISGQTINLQNFVNSKNNVSNCFLVTNTELNNNLLRFWEIEENNTSQVFSKEELECEEHFVKNYTRDHTGRFTVKLPNRDSYVELGNSLENATQRFYSLENKLKKNSQLKHEYSSFINEYEELGHMTAVDPVPKKDSVTYYLPHHAVIKSDSLTTKLRVVFDASAKTSSGLSLNDVLKVGPTIQSDLFSILIRFRQHYFVLIGDIAKMYRQVNVHPCQRDLQRIVWRDDPASELRHYALNTLTYGTAPASFLSTRCLKQVALDNQDEHPRESKIIDKDFYVDDLLTGANDINSLIGIRKNLVSILHGGGFELRKFMSNNPSVLQDLTSDLDNSNYVIRTDENTKTLGVSWNPNSDHFQYVVNLPCAQENATKRTILSYISQIFDPLGLLGAVIIQSKLILQKLWQLKVGWDSEIPSEIHSMWVTYYSQLGEINSVKIPRLVIVHNATEIQLHGFCDSSEKAYAATVYVRSTNQNGTIQVHLLCAKSRVAPLKSLSLPRLELCGALLLAKLITNVCSALTISIHDIYYWTDSTIVLSWLSAEPQLWQTFVRNRVSEIQQLTQVNKWHHVCSANNPADIISRGVSPKEIANSTLWWNGPPFLSQRPELWPQKSHISNFMRKSDIPERNNKAITLLSSEEDDFINSLINRYSSFTKLLRVIAFCLRFIHNLKVPTESRQTGFLDVRELEDATLLLIKLVQSQHFSDDIQTLKATNSVKPTSRLKSLNPFIDKFGVLRVGGRLRYSKLTHDSKHPILIPPNHTLTTLIIRYEHLRNLHSGPQATLASVRQKYWPLNGKQIVKKIIRKCIQCFKARPILSSQQMGDLPEPRVTPSRPFSFCGVDYAGPFQIKDGSYRNRKVIKCYICIFVCLSSKALHIELASDLTTEAFLNAFKRFISRRGMPTRMHSDNATNFHGAKNRLLSDINQMLKHEAFQNYLLQCKIQWEFIPPRAPHMGGLWEASVRSVKHHLKRVTNNCIFCYENFYTLLTQVEAVLNSRPLMPLSDSPDDFYALTPGHLLIGQPLNSFPETDFTEIKMNKLSKYDHVCKLSQMFWRKWSKQYLHHLQQRTKWRFKKEAAAVIGALVLLFEDNTPPLCWPMGRIIQLHPGNDGLVRVVSVKTNNGVVKRAINKVCLLPIEANDRERS